MQLNRRPRFDEISAIPADDKLDELLDRYLAYDDPRLGESERSQIVEVLAELDRGGQDADTAVDRLRVLLAQYPFVFAMWRMLYPDHRDLRHAGRDTSPVRTRAARSCLGGSIPRRAPRRSVG